MKSLLATHVRLYIAMDRVVVCSHGPRSSTRCDSLTALSDPTGTTWPNLLPGLLDTPCTARLRTCNIPARPISKSSCAKMLLFYVAVVFIQQREVSASKRPCKTPRPSHIYNPRKSVPPGHPCVSSTCCTVLTQRCDKGVGRCHKKCCVRAWWS